MRKRSSVWIRVGDIFIDLRSGTVMEGGKSK